MSSVVARAALVQFIGYAESHYIDECTGRNMQSLHWTILLKRATVKPYYFAETKLIQARDSTAKILAIRRDCTAVDCNSI